MHDRDLPPLVVDRPGAARPGVRPIVRGAGQAAGAAPGVPSRVDGPVQITAGADRRRMMDLLHVTSMPPGASGSSPATYDESTANPYPVLDALPH